MDKLIIEQIIKIRDTGKTNMFDKNVVQYLAEERGLFELSEFIEDHPKEYFEFILRGE